MVVGSNCKIVGNKNRPSGIQNLLASKFQNDLRENPDGKKTNRYDLDNTRPCDSLFIMIHFKFGRSTRFVMILLSSNFIMTKFIFSVAIDSYLKIAID